MLCRRVKLDVHRMCEVGHQIYQSAGSIAHVTLGETNPSWPRSWDADLYITSSRSVHSIFRRMRVTAGCDIDDYTVDKDSMAASTMASRSRNARLNPKGAI